MSRKDAKIAKVNGTAVLSSWRSLRLGERIGFGCGRRPRWGIHGNYEGELGSRFSTRIEGTCLKHFMANSGLKLYDKFGILLRLETVTNDVTFFQHYRKVEHRDGTWERKQAPLPKTIYSLPDLAELLPAANRRYLEFLSAVDDPTNGIRAVQQVSRPVQKNGRSYRGFNLFDEAEEKLFRVLARGEFNLLGLRSGDLRRHLPTQSPSHISHLLRRLRNHGILKKAPKRYRYYVTALGKRIIASALKLKEMFLIPSLCGLLPQP
ncbi:MAG: MarR family transcriptional regulator [Phycisphaerae bacterium]|nr:MarR family transcriptional regulator [Phycisphaerae bacterium]